MANVVRASMDFLVRRFVRLVLRLFFRDIEVLGADRLPRRRDGSRRPRVEDGILYVGNHYNSLIDPALALGWLPPGLRVLAKSTLWRHVPAGLFVRLAGAVPVYRRADPGVDASRNVESFARCFEILAGGGSIALFPEGRSHNEPGLQQLRTGAARIALGTVARSPQAPVWIVPFGLVFEERERFRSRVLIEIGQPIDPRSFATDDGEEDRAAVERLTEAVAAGLTAVTLNFSTWREADLVRRAAALWVADQMPAATALSSHVPYQRAFARGYAELKSLYPMEVRYARRAATAYFRLLDLAGLSDRQVSTGYSAALMARFVARSLFELLVLLPLGVVGTMLHWLPYKIPGWVVRALPIGRDQHATYKVMISLFLFPALWIGGAFLLADLWGWSAGRAFLVLAPLSGYAALRLRERLESVVLQSRAYLLLRGGGTLVARLRGRRAELVRALRELVAAYGDAGGR
jgi:1-acyl-sn-glycerol-3-phosphate acyltransferase